MRLEEAVSGEGEAICGTAEVERIARRIGRVQQHQSFRRRMPIGAEPLPGGGTHFRVWAPNSPTCAVELFASPTAPTPEITADLPAEGEGYFSGVVKEASEGSLYRFKLRTGSFPDPASRFQPTGPHGPSQVIDPQRHAWRDAQWGGIPKERAVIYEMHIGTFTPEGTWRAAMKELGELAQLGVTLLEVMPVADFCGRFGWGYDGVNQFAPTRLYGSPDDFRAFVDAAHGHGLGVILDVVYNHFGPDGNYLAAFSPDYFSETYECEWGEAINYDGPNNGPVREFFTSNAGYWVEEFHLDGLRLDATQQIFDSGERHILADIVQRVRSTAGSRSTFIVAENEPQHSRYVRDPATGGHGMDALWNDDFHHMAMVAATGHKEAYYTDYNGTPQEFISALKWGYLFQGQRYHWQKGRRGTPALDLEPANFVAFLQNHDQVANSLRGARLHELTTPGRFRALTTLTLLGPNPPMLFQGEEFAASAPFLYFADHEPGLARMVAEGRHTFLKQFKSLASPECSAAITRPEAEDTFRRCVLDFSERAKNSRVYAMHRDLLRLRREDGVFARARRRTLDGAVLGAEAFVLRYFGEHDDDRLVLVNLGRDLDLNPAPEPLLAPPRGRGWKVLFSTEDVAYGGGGTAAAETEGAWWLPGHAAVVLGPQEG